ncbi:MAG: RNA polymerase sigma factor [Clostridia bacterium]|nr:RNA polymerase sigma factor [Clostridia bacterium]MBR5441967.1 RNA polymerase sigma factor [Clostridia bacterium]
MLQKKEKTFESEYIKVLVDKYSNMIFRICYGVLCNRDDAEDALQDTFLKYLTKSPEFQDEEHEKAWLIRVATNISKNMSIVRYKRKTVDGAELVDMGVSYEDKYVFEAISELPVKLKIVMMLYYIEGYSVKEVSRIISVSEDAVRKRLQKGRELLKVKIERSNRDDV